MKIQLLVVGATTIPYVKNGIQEFTDRIRRFPTPFEIKVVADVKTSKRQRRMLRNKPRELPFLRMYSHQTSWFCLMSEAGNTHHVSSPHL